MCQRIIIIIIFLQYQAIHNFFLGGGGFVVTYLTLPKMCYQELQQIFFTSSSFKERLLTFLMVSLVIHGLLPLTFSYFSLLPYNTALVV
jgi:hypothetical protein